MSQVATVNEGNSLLSVIERAAKDDSVDIEKMERLMGLYQQMQAQSAKAEYDRDMAMMQPELPIVTEKAEIKHGGKVISRYAYWEDVNEAIRPALLKYGFAITFRTGRVDKERFVTCVVSHKGGHREETTLALPDDTTGSKNPVQAVGSSVSYGKRYTASALLNITTRGEDDDGGKAGAGEVITDAQAKEIKDLLKATDSNTKTFLEYLGLGLTPIASVDEMPAAMYERAKAALNKKRNSA